MDLFQKSPKTSYDDFDFKYVPKKDFERLTKNVERDRSSKDPKLWDNFCMPSGSRSQNAEPKDDTQINIKPVQNHGINSNIRVLSDDEIKNVIDTAINEALKRNSTVLSPFFGPVRKLDVEKLRMEEEKSNLDEESSDESSTRSSKTIIESKHSEKSVHIVEKFDVKNDHQQSKKSSVEKIEVQNVFPVVELKEKTTKNLNKYLSDSDDSDDINVWNPNMENKSTSRKNQHKLASVSVDGSCLSDKIAKTKTDLFPKDNVMIKISNKSEMQTKTSKKDILKSTKNQNAKELSSNWKEETMKSQANSIVHGEVMSMLGKITSYQKKICQCLQFLREIIDEPPDVEDVIDLHKRQKRSSEFTARFARNHLYQIGRFAEEIRLMPDNNPLDVATKITSLFQIITQASQTYLKNIECFIYNQYPDKLMVLVDFIINVTKICFDKRVFDKKDLVIQDMLRKCLMIKQFLDAHQHSMAKFAPLPAKSKKPLFLKSNSYCENPYKTNLSMYGMQVKKQKQQNMFNVPKNLYDGTTLTTLKPRNIQSSRTNRTDLSTQKLRAQTNKVSMKQSIPRSRSSRLETPISSRTSIVSTMMQHVEEEDKIQAEKLLENSAKVSSHEIQTIMEMLQNITKDKVHEILGPLIATLLPNSNPENVTALLKQFPTQQTNNQIFDNKTASRVTSALDKSGNKPEKQLKNVVQEIDCFKDVETKNFPAPSVSIYRQETVQHSAKNAQLIFMKSESENDNTGEESKTSLSQLSQNQIDESFQSKEESNSLKHVRIVTPHKKAPIPETSNKETKRKFDELKKHVLKERMEFIESISEDPLYVNERFEQPWKVCSKYKKILLTLLRLQSY
ncbi:unnamed protein product [Diamesa serratosioi]